LMPSLKLRNSEVEFSYLDSGEPQSTIYTTIVVVHGHSFHSGIFQRILPLAAPRGVRIIAVNRRDYPGSTLFSPAELDQLNNGEETGHASFLQARGVEMALFVTALIETLNLPKPSDDHTNGGIALMGWSLGNILPILIMSSIALLPVEMKTRLQLYVRRTILYDAPHLPFGFQVPTRLYLPFSDNTIPEADLGQVFGSWVSSYFAHKDLASRDADNLVDKLPDPSKKSTVSGMTEQELSSVVDFTPAQRSENAFMTTMQPALFRQTCKALFDRSTDTAWPNLKVWVLYGDCSPWPILFAAWEIEKMDMLRNKKRTMEHRVLNGANHFVSLSIPKI
ncbi:hypothetical protein BU17DRAFT_43319, partial [Hysterangium stoloniferum]